MRHSNWRECMHHSFLLNFQWCRWKSWKEYLVVWILCELQQHHNISWTEWILEASASSESCQTGISTFSSSRTGMYLNLTKWPMPMPVPIYTLYTIVSSRLLEAQTHVKGRTNATTRCQTSLVAGDHCRWQWMDVGCSSDLEAFGAFETGTQLKVHKPHRNKQLQTRLTS